MNRIARALDRTFVLLLCLGALVASVASASSTANYPDWDAVSDVQVIEVLTQDADGKARETKIWFVLMGGDPYLRTNGSRWLENIRRDPVIGLRIEGNEYRARAEEIAGEGLLEKVGIASKEKYGFQESLINVFRRRTPQILKLSPLEDPSAPSE